MHNSHQQNSSFSQNHSQNVIGQSSINSTHSNNTTTNNVYNCIHNHYYGDNATIIINSNDLHQFHQTNGQVHQQQHQSNSQNRIPQQQHQNGNHQQHFNGNHQQHLNGIQQQPQNSSQQQPFQHSQVVASLQGLSSTGMIQAQQPEQDPRSEFDDLCERFRVQASINALVVAAPQLFSNIPHVANRFFTSPVNALFQQNSFLQSMVLQQDYHAFNPNFAREMPKEEVEPPKKEVGKDPKHKKRNGFKLKKRQ